MSLSIDDPRPPYLQVADALRDDVSNGDLRSGQKLPSIRALSERFGVAQMTIQNALRQLREDGVVQTTPNRGSFVAPDRPGSPADPITGVASEIRSLREDFRHLAERVAALEAGK